MSGGNYYVASAATGAWPPSLWLNFQMSHVSQDLGQYNRTRLYGLCIYIQPVVGSRLHCMGRPASDQQQAAPGRPDSDQQWIALGRPDLDQHQSEWIALGRPDSEPDSDQHQAAPTRPDSDQQRIAPGRPDPEPDSDQQYRSHWAIRLGAGSDQATAKEAIST